MSETQQTISPWRLRLTAVMVLGVLGVFTGTLMSLVGRFWWFADLASHFAVYYTLAGAGLLVFALLLRRWVWSGLALFVVVVNGVLIWPTFAPVSGTVPPGASLLTLAQVNVLHKNRNSEAVRAFLDDCEADLIFVQEADEWWGSTIRGMAVPYTIVESQPREGSFGMLLLAHDSLVEDDAIVLRDTHVIDLADGFTGAERPAIEALLLLNGQPVRILSVHPPPPTRRQLAALRDSVLRQARQWSDEQTDPHVVIGDLNTSPWSYAFRILTDDGQLISTQDGWGNQGTWPTMFTMPWYLPIDHCLHSGEKHGGEWVCVDRWIGAYTGSDHWPLQVTLAMVHGPGKPASVTDSPQSTQLPKDVLPVSKEDIPGEPATIPR